MVVWSGEGKQKSKKQWQTNNVQNKIKIKFFSSSQFIHYDFRHNYATLPANFSSPLYFNQLHDYYFSGSYVVSDAKKQVSETFKKSSKKLTFDVTNTPKNVLPRQIQYKGVRKRPICHFFK
jgi:hypothetical protein